MSPFSSEFPGKLGNALDRLWQAVQRQKVIAGHGLRTEETPGGVAVHCLNTPMPPPATAVIIAQIVTEGYDALECTVDGGATTFVVMKPEALRMSRMVFDYNGGSYFIAGTTPTITQNTSVWDAVGFALDWETNAGAPDPRTETQIIWPPYVDMVTGSTSVNTPRSPQSSEAKNLICARVSGAGRVDLSNLTENPAGDTVVGFVDITGSRAWRALDEVMQTQDVRDVGGIIGRVDNI